MQTLTQDFELESIRLAELRSLCSSGRARAIRHDADLLLRDVAKDCGVNKSTIARWESGEARPTGSAALTYLEVLHRLEAAPWRLHRR